MDMFYRVPYEYMHFEWVSSHYDVHLEGLCRVNGELMYFKTEKSHLCYPWRNLRCHVFPLRGIDKLAWRIRQRLFEVCVGRHWSYPYRKTKTCKIYPLGRHIGSLYYHILNNL